MNPAQRADRRQRGGHVETLVAFETVGALTVILRHCLRSKPQKRPIVTPCYNGGSAQGTEFAKCHRVAAVREMRGPKLPVAKVRTFPEAAIHILKHGFQQSVNLLIFKQQISY